MKYFPKIADGYNYFRKLILCSHISFSRSLVFEMSVMNFFNTSLIFNAEVFNLYNIWGLRGLEMEDQGL